jgi:prevent-host-death family protein
MESMPVSQFKITCLSVLKQIFQQKKRLVITKRGKPIAQVIPYEEETAPVPLKDTVAFLGDIISPVATQDWEALP